MGWASMFKDALNGVLEPFNIAVSSRTAERAEMARLRELDAAGHFGRPVFPLLAQFAGCDPMPVLQAVKSHSAETARFARSPGEAGYSFDNDYFGSADAEVAYALVRRLRPGKIIEIGSGNSTHLFREAIRDGGLTTRLVSIDPTPRRSVTAVTDQAIARRVEHIPADFLTDALESGDILFIDSSHRISIGNDVSVLLLNIVPALRAGVIIHLHDIFLPYDYPRGWVLDHRWHMEEQYLVQAMLQGSDGYQVLWAAHYFQSKLPDFSSYFHQPGPSDATSLWLRKAW